jgi:hypothetical protein
LAQLIGWLYGFNTLGADGGAFLAGWFLIGTFGFDKAIYIGASVQFNGRRRRPAVGPWCRQGRR